LKKTNGAYEQESTNPRELFDVQFRGVVADNAMQMATKPASLVFSSAAVASVHVRQAVRSKPKQTTGLADRLRDSFRSSFSGGRTGMKRQRSGPHLRRVVAEPPLPALHLLQGVNRFGLGRRPPFALFF
jgi:hypothetical protein